MFNTTNQLCNCLIFFLKSESLRLSTKQRTYFQVFIIEKIRSNYLPYFEIQAFGTTIPLNRRYLVKMARITVFKTVSCHQMGLQKVSKGLFVSHTGKILQYQALQNFYFTYNVRSLYQESNLLQTVQTCMNHRLLVCLLCICSPQLTYLHSSLNKEQLWL